MSEKELYDGEVSISDHVLAIHQILLELGGALAKSGPVLTETGVLQQDVRAEVLHNLFGDGNRDEEGDILYHMAQDIMIISPWALEEDYFGNYYQDHHVFARHELAWRFVEPRRDVMELLHTLLVRAHYAAAADPAGGQGMRMALRYLRGVPRALEHSLIPGQKGGFNNFYLSGMVVYQDEKRYGYLYELTARDHKGHSVYSAFVVDDNEQRLFSAFMESKISKPGDAVDFSETYLMTHKLRRLTWDEVEILALGRGLHAAPPVAEPDKKEKPGQSAVNGAA